MSELIDRQAAIDAIDYANEWEVIGTTVVDKDDVIRQINVLPTIEERKTGRWIPCSERLPENGHYYLWCSDMGHVQSDYYWNGFENGMKYGYNIVAWMPLPEPYKGEDGGRA